MSIEAELAKIVDDLGAIAYRVDTMDVSNTEHALELIVDRLKAVQRIAKPYDWQASMVAVLNEFAERIVTLEHELKITFPPKHKLEPKGGRAEQDRL
jgi:hypothetical protein